MKKNLIRIFGTLLLTSLIAQFPLCAQPAPPASPVISLSAILDVMQRVADWQLANPSRHSRTDWTQGAGDAGMMALAGISGDPKYRDAMLALGATNNWKLGAKRYHADDQCVGQTYAELYLLYRQPAMIAPLREQFDAILEHPSTVTNFDFTQSYGKVSEQWSWCDSLFMAPPVWLRLYAATGDEKYLNFAVTNWWRTTEYLYDPREHLFFRDSTFFHKHEANGKKVFWGRGNGWVLGGLVRVLQYLPMNHPDRPRFERLFKDIAAKILTCQQPDGLWRASLLDPQSFPLQEVSGSGFFTYGLAWGVNQGLLDRAKFEPAVRLAWSALAGCVDADGKLTHVQPVGADPKSFAPASTEVYGVGAFLLAGSELYRLTVLENSKSVTVKVTNPAKFWRENETIELNLTPATASSLEGKDIPFGEPKVMDGATSRILDSQVYQTNVNNLISADSITASSGKFLFQVDLAPGETRYYKVIPVGQLAAVPPPIVKTFARYVPERMDDFAWESDRIAHRIYGQALAKKEGTISSGADVWIKKDRGLIVDALYRSGHYHSDNGVYMDDYRVGNSRGCGGLGIWDGQKLFTSGNWRNWKLITSGPIRSEFELTYDAWDVGNGRSVSETKRFSIDAGSWFTKAQCTLVSTDKSALTIGVGLAERSCGPGGTEVIGQDVKAGWMTYWEPEDKPKGVTAVAIVLPNNRVKEFTTDSQDMPESKLQEAVPQPTVEGAPAIRNLLAITKIPANRPFTYYFGACWDRSGDFTNPSQWDDYVKRFAERCAHPLVVKLEK